MSEFIGQDKLKNSLFGYDLQTLPKAILFIGEHGCGKHTLANLIAEHLGIEFIAVQKDVTAEDLIAYSTSSVAKLYCIDLKDFTTKQQNKLLKFIEEPAKSVYIILLAEDEHIGILPTVLNRCYIFKFESYSTEELKEISGIDDRFMLKALRTPGKLLTAKNSDFAAVKQLCKMIVTKIPKASYANTLSIADKINYKEEYNKVDFDIFFDVLSTAALTEYINNGSELAFKVYSVVRKKKEMTVNTKVNKETFMLNMLSALWEETRCYSET